jgi:hypothetical protein
LQPSSDKIVQYLRNKKQSNDKIVSSLVHLGSEFAESSQNNTTRTYCIFGQHRRHDILSAITNFSQCANPMLNKVQALRLK